MKKFVRSVQTYWLEDASFVTLFVMLLAVVFALPVVIENSQYGVLFFNVILLSVFLSGIFSAGNKITIALASVLFSIHLTLRIIRFGNNPYSFYTEENLIAMANVLLFIYINMRLIFRDNSVNLYRIIGAVNVYLLLALFGALAFEVIHAISGQSIAGSITLKGEDSDYRHFIYFSLISLTTVGYGDILPVSMEAKMLASMLSMAGMLFPAIIIARLVGLASKVE